MYPRPKSAQRKKARGFNKFVAHSVFAHLLVLLLLSLVQGHSAIDKLNEPIPIKIVKLETKKLPSNRPTLKNPSKRPISKGGKKPTKGDTGKARMRKTINRRIKGVLKPQAKGEPLQKVRKQKAALSKPMESLKPSTPATQQPTKNLKKKQAVARLLPQKPKQSRTKKINPTRKKLTAKLDPSYKKNYTSKIKPMRRKSLSLKKEIKSTKQKHLSQKEQTQKVTHTKAAMPKENIKLRMIDQEAPKVKTERQTTASHTPVPTQTAKDRQVKYERQAPPSSQVKITEKRVKYKHTSTPMVRQMKLDPAKTPTKVTQTTTSAEYTEKITQMTKELTVMPQIDDYTPSSQLLKKEMSQEKASRFAEKAAVKTKIMTVKKKQREITIEYTYQEKVQKSTRPVERRVNYTKDAPQVSKPASMTHVSVFVPEISAQTKATEEIPQMARKSAATLPRTSSASSSSKFLKSELAAAETPKFGEKTATLAMIRTTPVERSKARVEYSYDTAGKKSALPAVETKRQPAYSQSEPRASSQAAMVEITDFTEEFSTEATASSASLGSISKQEQSSRTLEMPDEGAIGGAAVQVQQDAVIQFQQKTQEEGGSAESGHTTRANVRQPVFTSTGQGTQARSKIKNLSVSRGGSIDKTTKLAAISTLGSRSGKGRSATGAPKSLEVDIDLPAGNTLDQALYHLQGTIGQDVKMAFITVNDVTQLVNVEGGRFDAEIALAQGVNAVEVLAFSSGGGMGKETFNLIFAPPGRVPVVTLTSPENGKQGVREGDPIIVEGTVDDPTITKVTLFMNRVPIKIKAKNGRFRRKVFIPRGRITSFRAMAKNLEGTSGYSALHTVLSGYEIDLLNPRPY